MNETLKVLEPRRNCRNFKLDMDKKLKVLIGLPEKETNVWTNFIR